MVLRFTVAAPPTNLSVWSVTISVVFLSEPKTILFIKAEFYKIKQKFVIEYAYLSVLYYAFLHKNKKREEKHMEKMILADKTELEIQAGGSLGANVVVVPDFADLKTVAEALTKEGNLKTVQYKTDEQVTGEYTDMKLETPLFKTVDYTKEKKVIATFGIREKTELEKEVDKIKAQQVAQDGAILDLAGLVGGEV